MHSSNFWRTQAPPLLNDLGLLALRLWLAQEFVFAGYTKVAGGLHAPAWFASLPFPFPLSLLGADLNWLMAGAGEVMLGLALVLGLLTRLAAAGLLYVTYVAVHTVHFDLGWAGWNQIETETGLGYKVPLMIGLMLFTLLTQGGGQYALDARRTTPRKPAPVTLPT